MNAKQLISMVTEDTLSEVSSLQIERFFKSTLGKKLWSDWGHRIDQAYERGDTTTAAKLEKDWIVIRDKEAAKLPG